MTDTETKLLPLGVHFGLPDEMYFADPGLGSTQVKELNIDALEYWWASSMNPYQEERKSTDAMKFGTAIHRVILEGPEAFKAKFSIAPRKSDHEGLLVTNDDLKKWLDARGHSTKGTKPVLIAAAQDGGCTWPIWDVLLDEHKADCEMRGTESLDADVADQILMRTRVINANPQITKHLTGGYSEVTVIWEDEDGVRWKARIDYVRKDGQADLKSFQNQFKEPIIKAIAKRITALQGHIQVKLHWTGVQMAKQMIIDHGADAVFSHHPEEPLMRSGCIDGHTPDEQWLIDFASMPPGGFHWVFVQSTNAPVVRALQCPQSNKKEVSDVWNDASLKISYAKMLWMKCKEQFIDGEAWIDTEPQEKLEDWHFPPHIIG